MEAEVRDSDVSVRCVVSSAEVVLAHANPDGAPVEPSWRDGGRASDEKAEEEEGEGHPNGREEKHHKLK